MMKRKTIIDREAALTLVPLWEEFIARVKDLELAIADFISTSSF